MLTCYSYKKKECIEQLPIGKYVLKSKYNAFKKETPFEIKAGEPTKLHIIFEQFRIETKCSNMKSQVSYEVYANSGRMVYDAKKLCSEALQLTLDAGDYSVEASIGNDKKKEKFSIGKDSKKLIIDMTDSKKEPTKEELIKADSQETSHSSKIVKKENVADAMKQVGAILGGAKKSIESKPLKAFKESLTVALPFMEKTNVCYAQAKTLEDAKKCDDIANEGSLIAQKKMTEIVGISGKKIIPIYQKEWNGEIQKKKVAKEAKDLHDAKLTIVCIDKGAGMREIQKCVKNNGEFVHQKSDMEQLGGLLQMFGGKK